MFFENLSGTTSTFNSLTPSQQNLISTYNNIKNTFTSLISAFPCMAEFDETDYENVLKMYTPIIHSPEGEGGEDPRACKKAYDLATNRCFRNYKIGVGVCMWSVFGGPRELATCHFVNTNVQLFCNRDAYTDFQNCLKVK